MEGNVQVSVKEDTWLPEVSNEEASLRIQPESTLVEEYEVVSVVETVVELLVTGDSRYSPQILQVMKGLFHLCSALLQGNLEKKGYEDDEVQYLCWQEVVMSYFEKMSYCE